ncbi:MAG: hypothetical protein ACC658_06290 [Acidimicrobiia bacterium]
MTTIQEFAVIATGEDLDNNDFLNRLFEATGGDITFECDRHGEVATIWFDREAESLKQAVVKAIRQLHTLPELSIRSVEIDDIVTQDQISEKTGMSRQVVSMHVNEQRGTKHFPLPVVGIPQRVRVWRLADIYDYFDREEDAERLRRQRSAVDEAWKRALEDIAS